jgi:hypothetical protein
MRTRFESEFGADAGKFVEITDAIGTKAEVFPDHHDACAQREQDVFCEFPRALCCERAIERNDNDAAARHRLLAQVSFSFESCEQRGSFSTEHFGWMRRESEYDRFEAMGSGKIGSFVEYSAMSAMNPVEVADGNEARWFFLFVHEAIHRAVRSQRGRCAQSLLHAKRIRSDCALTVQVMTGSSAPPFTTRQRRLRQ